MDVTVEMKSFTRRGEEFNAVEGVIEPIVPIGKRIPDQGRSVILG
jgi:hypothetical protein